jgi:hypothetical protein
MATPFNFFSAQSAAKPNGATFARQPCSRIPIQRNLGQRLCAPLFREVCLFQAFDKNLVEQHFSNYDAKQRFQPISA